MLQLQLDMTQSENGRLQRDLDLLQRSLRSKESLSQEEKRLSPAGFYPVMSSPEGERQEGEVRKAGKKERVREIQTDKERYADGVRYREKKREKDRKKRDMQTKREIQRERKERDRDRE